MASLGVEMMKIQEKIDCLISQFKKTVKDVVKWDIAKKLRSDYQKKPMDL